MSITRKAKSVKFTCSIISLTVEINDARYSVDEIPAGEFGSKAFRLTKHSARDGGAVYDVIRDVYGCVACDCPSYETTHRGTASMCKHGRALVELGLMPGPIAPAGHIVDVSNMSATVACCSPSEPAPCTACVEPAPEPEPEPLDVEYPPVDLPGIGETFREIPEALPGELVDPADAESDPQLWGDEHDAYAWCLGPAPEPDAPDGPTAEPETPPAPGADPEAPAPAPAPAPDDEDTIDYRELPGESEARHHLDHSERLTLVELIDRQRGFYEAWGNTAGRMFAAAMAELAFKARLTSATTPDELEARAESLEADARAQWEAVGYDAAMSECGERAALAGHFGHPA